MKITGVETFLVPPRWLFVKVSTDEGVSGWGEASLEGRTGTARSAVVELEDYLIGEDPLHLEKHWQMMTKSTFYRGGPVLSTAVAGIDQALWDIAGKWRGAPVHELLGGPVRDRARVYSWVGGDTPGKVMEEIANRKEHGFDAVKMNAPGPLEPLDKPAAIARIVALASSAREALGPDADFALDFHGRFSAAMARRVLRELEPLKPMFVEEPVLPEFIETRLAEVTGSTVIPIAVGERLFSRSDFLPALRSGIAVAQPDISHCGGISEARRIAVLAECFDVNLAPHCPLGPIALAASLQVAFATPNFLIQEQSAGIHYNKGDDLLDYLVDPSVFMYKAGYCERPVKPGLGIEVDEAAVRRAVEVGEHWRTPHWQHLDGSFAEW
ncbi:MAG: galactonate dehydratase [Acidimicrobiales bacterium]|jgi:galactonate dehydratase